MLAQVLQERYNKHCENNEIAERQLTREVNSDVTHVLLQPDTPQDAGCAELEDGEGCFLVFDRIIRNLLVDKSLNNSVEYECNGPCDEVPFQTLPDYTVESLRLVGEESEQQERCADGHLHSSKQHKNCRSDRLEESVAFWSYVLPLALQSLLAYISFVVHPTVKGGEEKYE